MSFVDKEISREYKKGDFKKTEFMSVTNGAHIIRILEDQAKTLPTHFFMNSKSSVLCLEDECPICKNNKDLIRQYPENFRDQPGYNKVNYRFFVNVLDKTPAKVCEKCGKEYKDTRQTICTCGEVLPTAAPLNKVKVLSKGLQLRDDLGSVEKAILDTDGNVIGLKNYDVIIMTTGAGTRDAKNTPVPRTEANQPVPESLELFDIDKAVIKLEPSEMLDLQRGISIKDIFAARKAKQEEFVPEEIAPQADIDAVQAKVNALFNQ
jgi:hypothetical protein